MEGRVVWAQKVKSRRGWYLFRHWDINAVYVYVGVAGWCGCGNVVCNVQQKCGGEVMEGRRKGGIEVETQRCTSEDEGIHNECANDAKKSSKLLREHV